MKKLVSLVIGLVILLQTPLAFALTENQRRVLNADSLYYNTESSPVCAGSGTTGANTGPGLPENIPPYWRDLINAAAPKYPYVDPRIVAAVLYVENNSWPDPNSQWGESGASARGPFQFLPQTWFGWNTGITNWNRVYDESAYSPTGLGTDGDGDGRRDPNNPRDAVEAAYKHHQGSATKPIAVQGYNASASLEDSVTTTVFEDNTGNLLHFARKYNGSGAPNGATLSSFMNLPNGAAGRENKEYVLAAFALLHSNFTRSYDYPKNEFGTPSQGEGSGTPGPGGSNALCGSGTGTVSTEGYSFPVAPQTKSGNGRVTGMSGLPCRNASGCHHDGTVAFDMSKNPGGDPAVGTALYAISDGQIKNIRNSYKGQSGCQSLQLVSSKDNFWYAYLHIQNISVSDGQTVTAGQQIAVIGERRCTGNGSDPHLHIDRGCIQNGTPKPGGGDGCRDPGFNDLINSLWEGLPE